MARRSGLGKGLESLIPSGGQSTGSLVGAEVSAAADLQESAFREVPITSIDVNPLQPRKHVDETALEPLADSIKELGVLQPILVRKVEDRLELIAGERRWRASKLAGLVTVPVIVRDAGNVHSLEQALVENLHRKDLNPLDEASAYRQLIDDFSMTHDEVGKRVGKNRATITNLIRLLQLPAKVQRLLVEEKITEGHGRALLGTDDEAFAAQLADRVVREGLTVRAVEEAVRLRNELAKPETKERSKGGRPSSRTPAILEVQEWLTDILDTRVTITPGAKRGKIVIDFADLADLDRIAEVISVGNTDEDTDDPR